MFLSLECKAFPGKTFNIICHPNDSVARVRANVLHILSNLGISNVPFRLRFNGEYLKDTLTLSSYGISDLNASMFRLELCADPDTQAVHNKSRAEYLRFQAENSESGFSQRLSLTPRTLVRAGSEALLSKRVRNAQNGKTAVYTELEKSRVQSHKLPGQAQLVNMTAESIRTIQDVSALEQAQRARSLRINPVIVGLNKEKKWFTNRQWLLRVTHGCFWAVLILALLAFITTVWYVGVWTFLFAVLAIRTQPTFSMVGGFMKPTTKPEIWWMDVVTFLAIVTVAGQAFSAFLELGSILDCDGGSALECPEALWSAGVLLSLLIVAFPMVLLLLSLRRNLRRNAGDLLERILVRANDPVALVAAGRREAPEERRAAALEMGALAAVGNVNRGKLLQAGSIPMLMMLAVTDDDTTREYAAEALATLLQSPEAVEAFVKEGGLEVLFALLQDTVEQTIREGVEIVAHVLSYPSSRQVFIKKRGTQEVITLTRRLGMLSDLTASLLAEVLLELAIDSESRKSLAHQEVTEGLVELAVAHPDVAAVQCTTALQALELLACEKQDVVVMYHHRLFPRILELVESPGARRHLILAVNLLRLFALHPHSQHDTLRAPKLVTGLQMIVEGGDSSTFLAVGEICLAGLREAREMMVTEGIGMVVAYLLANSTADGPRKIASQCKRELAKA